jgi:hypothetical protein
MPTPHDDVMVRRCVSCSRQVDPALPLGHVCVLCRGWPGIVYVDWGDCPLPRWRRWVANGLTYAGNRLMRWRAFEASAWCLSKACAVLTEALRERWPYGSPGSEEARVLGCLCPVVDNRHGRGIPRSTGPRWCVARACQLHYWGWTDA